MVSEDFCEDGKIGGVALGDGNYLAAGGDESDGVGVAGDGVDGEVFVRGNLGKPFGPGVDEVDFAGQGGEDGDECLDDVACAKDGDVPCGRGAVELEEEGHFPAAGHADIALEVPGDEFGGRRVFLGKEGCCVGEGAGFDFTSADGAGVEAVFCGDEFLAGHSGDAATCGRDCDEYSVGALLVEMEEGLEQNFKV